MDQFGHKMYMSLCGTFVFAGFLIDFIPYPVINSFTVAAAITIAFGQVKVGGNICYI